MVGLSIFFTVYEMTKVVKFSCPLLVLSSAESQTLINDKGNISDQCLLLLTISSHANITTVKTTVSRFTDTIPDCYITRVV